MKHFWREYWLWICVPVVLVLALILAALFFAGGDETSPFIYTIR